MDKTLKVIALCGCLMSLGINGAHSETIETQIAKIKKAGWSVNYKEDEFTDIKTISISKMSPYKEYSSDKRVNFETRANSDKPPISFCVIFDYEVDLVGDVLFRVDKKSIYRISNSERGYEVCNGEDGFVEDLRNGKSLFIRTGYDWGNYGTHEVTFAINLNGIKDVLTLLKQIQPNEVADIKPIQSNDAPTEKVTSREMLEMIFAP